MARWVGSVLCLIACSLLAGCFTDLPRHPDESVVVYVVDSPADRSFVEGRSGSVRAEKVSHGSLVGRVLARNTSATLRFISAIERDGSLDEEAYLAALQRVASRARRHPRRSVLNLSLSSTAPSERERELIQDLQDAGVLVIAAAGNTGQRERLYPAAYPGVIAVAAAQTTGRAPSSTYGDHIAVCASGDMMFISHEFVPGLVPWLQRTTRTEGTSFAAPRVAGTVAELMVHDRSLSSRDALDIVLSTADAVNGEEWQKGLLGAGVMDRRGAIGRVAVGYRVAHHLLPALVWVVLGLLSAWLCFRMKSPGVFMALMLWLIVFPLTVWLYMEGRGLVRVLGNGRAGPGIISLALLLGAAEAGRRIQNGQWLKTALSVAGPYALLLMYRFAVFQQRATLPAPVGALIAGAAGLGICVVNEGRTRRRIERIRSEESAERLVSMHERAHDERLRHAALNRMADVQGAEVVDYLLHQDELSSEGVLERIARENPEQIMAAQPRHARARRRAAELPEQGQPDAPPE